jgi:protoporphyrinogen oxidase
VCAPAAQSLRYRDFITVALVLRDEGGLFPDNWIYIHDTKVKVGRIQNFAQLVARTWCLRSGRRLCLGLEYFCFEGDNLWSTARTTTSSALATREIEALGLARVAGQVIGRLRSCGRKRPIPVYDEDYAAGSIDAAMRKELRSDHTRHCTSSAATACTSYNNQDHAMMTAMLTVGSR